MKHREGWILLLILSWLAAGWIIRAERQGRIQAAKHRDGLKQWIINRHGSKSAQDIYNFYQEAVNVE